MNRLNSLRQLLVVAVVSLFALTAYAGEDEMDWKFSHSAYTTADGGAYAEMQINWANTNNNDSYTKYLTVSAAGTTWTINTFNGDNAKDKYGSCQFWMGTETKNGITMRYGWTWKSGDDYWVDVQFFFPNVYDGQEISVGWNATYRANRKKDVACGKSGTCKVSTESKHWIGKATAYSTGKNQFKVIAKTPSAAIGGRKYQSYLLKEDRGLSELISPTSSYAVGHTDMVEGANKDLTFTMTGVSSNYTPTAYYQRYIINQPCSDYSINFYNKHSTVVYSPHFIRAKSLKANVQNQWTRTVLLSWQVEKYDDSAIGTGWWLITRKTSNGTEEFVGAISNNKTTSYVTPTSTNVNGKYKYKVSFVPSAWGKPDASNFSSMRADDLTAESGDVAFTLDFKISDLSISDVGSNQGFRLNWTSTQIGDGKTYQFHVYRYLEGQKSTQADELGTVDTNSDATYEFIDNTISDYSIQYTYYVSVEILGSNCISKECSHISQLHSTIDNFIASTGEYENLITLNWTTNIVGTATSYYQIYRKKESQSDVKYMLLTSMSGMESSYTYTDNSINPGDIYTYKLVMYSKRSDGTQYGVETMSSYGFASRTGVITGSVTFDTGTAVGDVMVKLENADVEDQDSYALRIDGPGSGINWTPGGSTLTDLFSAENNSWTIQTLINPDEMGHDARFMQLGDMALTLGSLNDGYYNLYITKMNEWVNAQTLYDEGRLTTVSFKQIRYKTIDCGAKTPDTYCYVTFSNGFRFTPIRGEIKLGSQFIRNPYPKCSSDGWVYYTFDTSVKCVDWQKNVDLSDFEILVPSTGVTSLVDGIKIPVSKYSSLNITNSGSLLTITDVEDIEEGTVYTQSTVSEPIILSDGVFTMGSVGISDASTTFTGYLDEVRVFSGRALSLEEILNSYDCYLSGLEKGLVVYWKMDEGISNQDKVYDCSMTDGTPNSNHSSIVGKNYRIEGSLTSHNLNYYAKTDSKGSYVLRGIPYKGTGTNFTVTPFKGVHKFSPTTRTRLLTQNANTFNSTDFTDVSSFDASGVVYYDGTNYPVEDAILYVDGEPASIEGELVKTNSEGKFKVSVPIGDHSISVKKDGHTFVNNGRYPEQGTVSVYDEINNLTFYDNTLVVFAGRVCGGSVENNKPLGMGQSVNNIGRATVTLSTSYMQTGTGMLNVSKKVEGKTVTYDYASTERIFQYDPASATTTTALVGKGSEEAAKTITITTDSKTGEFAVLLPPLRYIVEGVEINNNQDSIKYGDMAEVNLTDTHLTYTDSLVSDSITVSRYSYNAKLPISVYHPAPDFVLTQQGMAKGVFGDDKITKSRKDGAGTTISDTIAFYTVNSSTGKVDYKYNYPVFTMLKKYQFNVKIQEVFHNYDNTNQTVTQYVPLSGSTLTFANSLSAEDYGLNTQTNELVAIQNHTITLDSLGEAKYVFRAGFPNMEASMDYRLSMDITYNIDGTDYQYVCPFFANIPDANGKFYGINFGNISLGNDFVTAGPDRVDMVLRDPPGSNSSATWKKGSSFSSTHATTISDEFSTDGYIGMQMGAKEQVGIGLGVIQITEIKGKASTGWMTDVETSDASTNATTTTYTATEDISTSSDPEWDGPDADIFIGTSSNTTIGTVKNVGLHWDGSDWKLNMKQQTSLGETFATTFNYTRFYIENTLIPQYQSFYNELKEKRLTNGQLGFKTIVQNGDSVVYDSLDYYNQQIENWEKWLAVNECEKVTAIKNQSKYLIDNYSFDSGATITNTTTNQNAKSSSEVYSKIFSNGLKITSGITFNGIGPEVTDVNMWTDKKSVTESKDTVTWSTFSYTLNDADVDDALSVDVYQSPEGYSPIFRTRGGRTSRYYEPQHMTKYLTKYYPHDYTAEQEIMSSTKKVYVPKIFATKTEYVNVPAGSRALLEFTIANESETDDYGYFTFALETKSNPDNAEILFSGVNDYGATYMLEPGKPQTLTVEVRQTNLDVKDYSLLFKLLDNTQSQKYATVPQNIDTVRVNIHFVEASSAVEFAVKNPYCNSASSKAQFTLSGYDMQMKNLKQIGLQYKIPGKQEWYTNHIWKVSNENKTNNDSTIYEASLSYPLQMDNTYIQGTYQFRAFTISNFGGQDIYAYSDIVEVTKDTESPQMLGVAQPANGVYGVGSEISVTFNEDIVAGDLSSQSVQLRGVLEDGNDDVSVYFNGDQGITTQSKVKEFSSSNTMTLWVKRLNENKTGTLFTRSNEAAASFLVDTAGHLIVYNKALDFSKTSERIIPKGKWVLLTIAIEHQDKTDLCEIYAIEEGSASSNPEPIMSFEYPASNYVSGKLVIGKDFVGYMKQLTIWEKYMDITTIVSTLDKSKTQFTSNLIAYWPMNEGSGLTASEVVSNNSLVLNNKGEWHIDRTNLSYSAVNNCVPVFDTSDIATGIDDDWALQFWFRANTGQNGSPLLFDINNGATKVTLDKNTGRLSLVDSKATTLVCEESYLDNEWHRFGMNVSKSNKGMATIYIDDKSKLSVPATQLSVIKGNLKLGKDFDGNFDEVRLYRHTLPIDEINQSLYQKLNTSVSDVALYLPFETDTLNAYNQTEVVGTFKDMSANGTKILKDFWGTSLATSPTICPPVKSADVLKDVKFDIVKSERTIQLKIKDTEQSKIQGRRLYATISNVKDFAGNTLNQYTWDFLVSLDKLRWNIESLEKDGSDICYGTYEIAIVNNTDVEQAWNITNIPSWMTLDHTSGTTAAFGTTPITCQLSGNMPMGLHAGNLYLNETETEFSRPLPYSFCYTPQIPDWNTLANKREFTMNIVGQVVIDGAKQMNSYSKMAAFDNNGECVGVSALQYHERTDGYYISMTVYGDANDEGLPLRFRFYDANTGLVYASFTGDAIKFKPDEVVGSYLVPHIWTADGNIEQTLNLTDGWSMFSINVVPTENRLASIITPEKLQDITSNNINDIHAVIQSSTKYACFDNGQWNGELTTIDPGKAYKWNYEEPVMDVKLLGRPAADENITIELKPGWNWIGANVSRDVPILTALSDINPANGDLIKTPGAYTTLASFASFEQGGWIGNLEYIMPGVGYMYNNTSTDTKTFRYPTDEAVRTATKARMESMSVDILDEQVDSISHIYTGTMLITSAITFDGMRQQGLTLRAYDSEGNLRGVKQTHDEDERSLIYMIVYGEDAGPIHFTATTADGRIYQFDETLIFNSGLIIGTPSVPHLFRMEQATDIQTVSKMRSKETEFRSYNAAGQQVGSSYKGIVIDKNNKKHLNK